MKKPVKLAIVDDHQIVIDGLKALLDGHPDIRISFETTSPSTVIDQLKSQPVDILLTDVMMEEMSGTELAKKARRQFPELKILALSMNGQGFLINQMIEESDISGYILKNTGKEELITALEKIARGGIYFSEEVIAEMERSSSERKKISETPLTSREIEIISLIEKELNNRQIAEQLFISERTVETHRKNIFRKTGTNSVIGLIKYAYEHDLIK